jgi:sirohydrochlorin ferrochelatase
MTVVNRAVLLLGHGSKAQDAHESMYRVAEVLRAEGQFISVECAFLEINQPDIPHGLDLCWAAGATEIVIVPYFLSMGRHVKEDLPRIISEWGLSNPAVKVIQAEHLSFSPHMVALVRERIFGAIS